MHILFIYVLIWHNFFALDKVFAHPSNGDKYFERNNLYLIRRQQCLPHLELENWIEGKKERES